MPGTGDNTNKPVAGSEGLLQPSPALSRSSSRATTPTSTSGVLQPPPGLPMYGFPPLVHGSPGMNGNPVGFQPVTRVPPVFMQPAEVGEPDMANLDVMELKKIELEKNLKDVEKAMASMKEHQTKKEETESVSFDNRYTTKKTIGKGMLDFGLLLMNIAQLKLLVSLGSDRLDFFWPNVILIIISIILQIAVGVVLTILGASQVTSVADKRRANRLNNTSLGLIFIIATVNTLVAAVGVSENGMPNAQLNVTA